MACIAVGVSTAARLGGGRPRRRLRTAGIVAALEEGLLDRPRWAGETPLSRLVGALIAIKPLYALMKLASREVIIRTAEKANVRWRDMAKEVLESREVRELFDEIRDPSIVYPDYYLSPFHAYDDGNLSWLAAAEAEAATISIAKRAIPDASSADEAMQAVRGTWISAIERHLVEHSGGLPVNDILDVGCSVGVSTRFLADKFPSARAVGLDLSPYFLAVAAYRDKNISRNNPISWIHANGEATGLPSNSFDLISLAYVCHECPARAITGLVKEAFRLLRPGGTLAITDNSPRSKVLQELPPVLFTLMKSTEPFLDEYYLLDLEKTMADAGFVNISSILTDPRHRTVTASVPF